MSGATRTLAWWVRASDERGGSREPHQVQGTNDANRDVSTAMPALTVKGFVCFVGQFGCP
jgi:hypothetical protein